MFYRKDASLRNFANYIVYIYILLMVISLATAFFGSIPFKEKLLTAVGSSFLILTFTLIVYISRIKSKVSGVVLLSISVLLTIYTKSYSNLLCLIVLVLPLVGASILYLINDYKNIY